MTSPSASSVTAVLSGAWSSAVAYATGRTSQTLMRAILATMVILDALLILAHVATGSARIAFEVPFTEALHDKFSIFSDDSIPEHFNFVKWTMAIVFTLAAARWGRSRAARWLVPMFAIFLVDDAGRVHERTGDWLAETVLAERYGGFTNAVGEIAVFAVLGMIQVTLLVCAFYRSTAIERPVLVGMTLTIAGLAVFGVLVDALHAAVIIYMPGLLVDQAMGLVEDGAELVLITILCLCGFRLLQVALDGHPG